VSRDRSRRTFLRGVVAASVGLLAGCAVAPGGTPSTSSHRLVFLFTRLTEVSVQNNIAILRRTLQEMGYVEGRHITYEGVDAQGDSKRFPVLANDIVASRPDIVVCQNVLAALAFKAATTTIPILFVNLANDPVETNIVASLRQPGANVTGLTNTLPEVFAKRLQLTKEMIPNVTRVVVVQDKAEPGSAMTAIQRTASSLGVEVVPIYMSSDADLDAALTATVDARPDALMFNAVLLTGGQNGPRIASFAIEHRIPLIGAIGDGLMQYTSQLAEPWQRAAVYVDRILKGANPGDLPVEGPTRSSFVINLCTAAKIGIKVPPLVMAQATSFVECST
jgi:putative ABC transport system substrate-binding protein